jgi:hypothetical protein
MLFDFAHRGTPKLWSAGRSPALPPLPSPKEMSKVVLVRKNRTPGSVRRESGQGSQ